MKFQEIIAQSGVVEDCKARRITNVSGTQANITADEIEDGVTIERLESLNVPVFKYTTQITIHGKLPEFSDTARPGGYNSIVRNQNGSIGVRYVALDGEKKQRIVRVSRLSEKREWNAHINSKGLTISRYFSDREECLTAYRAFPRDLYAGSCMAAEGAYGGYYVIADVGAIYERDVWALCGALWGIGSAAEAEALEAARAERYAAEKAEQVARIAARRAELDAEQKKLAEELSATLTPMRTLPKGATQFVRPRSDGHGSMLWILRKRGPSLCFKTFRYTPGMKAPESLGTMKRLADYQRQVLEQDARDGKIFAI